MVQTDLQKIDALIKAEDLKFDATTLRFADDEDRRQAKLEPIQESIRQLTEAKSNIQQGRDFALAVAIARGRTTQILERRQQIARFKAENRAKALAAPTPKPKPRRRSRGGQTRLTPRQVEEQRRQQSITPAQFAREQRQKRALQTRLTPRQLEELRRQQSIPLQISTQLSPVQLKQVQEQQLKVLAKEEKTLPVAARIVNIQKRIGIIQRQKPSLQREAKLVALTFASTFISAGLGFVQLPSTIKSVVQNPAQLKSVPAKIKKSGQKFIQIVRVSPTRAIAIIAGEVVVLALTGSGLKVIGKVPKAASKSLKVKLLKRKKTSVTFSNGRVTAIGKTKFRKTPFSRTFTPERISTIELRRSLRTSFRKKGANFDALSAKAQKRAIKILRKGIIKSRDTTSKVVALKQVTKKVRSKRTPIGKTFRGAKIPTSSLRTSLRNLFSRRGLDFDRLPLATRRGLIKNLRREVVKAREAFDKISPVVALRKATKKVRVPKGKFKLAKIPTSELRKALRKRFKDFDSFPLAKRKGLIRNLRRDVVKARAKSLEISPVVALKQVTKKVRLKKTPLAKTFRKAKIPTSKLREVLRKRFKDFDTFSLSKRKSLIRNLRREVVKAKSRAEKISPVVALKQVSKKVRLKKTPSAKTFPRAKIPTFALRNSLRNLFRRRGLDFDRLPLATRKGLIKNLRREVVKARSRAEKISPVVALREASKKVKVPKGRFAQTKIKTSQIRSGLRAFFRSRGRNFDLLPIQTQRALIKKSRKLIVKGRESTRTFDFFEVTGKAVKKVAKKKPKKEPSEISFSVERPLPPKPKPSIRPSGGGQQQQLLLAPQKLKPKIRPVLQVAPVTLTDVQRIALNKIRNANTPKQVKTAFKQVKAQVQKATQKQAQQIKQKKKISLQINKLAQKSKTKLRLKQLKRLRVAQRSLSSVAVQLGRQRSRLNSALKSAQAVKFRSALAPRLTPRAKARFRTAVTPRLTSRQATAPRLISRAIQRTTTKTARAFILKKKKIKAKKLKGGAFSVFARPLKRKGQKKPKLIKVSRRPLSKKV